MLEPRTVRVRERRLMAAGLRKAARLGESHARSGWSGSPVSRVAAAAATEDLRLVAYGVLEPGVFREEALDRVHEILTDGRSPLYRPRYAHELRDQLREVLALLAA
jgi:hypothetical protein